MSLHMTLTEWREYVREARKEYGPAEEWCSYGDPSCGKPNADGIASFCDKTCWKAAGKPAVLTKRERRELGLA